MSESQHDLLALVVDEVEGAFAPLRETLPGALQLYDVVSRRGWHLDALDGSDGADLAVWRDALVEAWQAIGQLADAVDEGESLDALLPRIGQRLASAWQGLADVDLVRTFSTAPLVQPLVVASLPGDLLEWMLLSALERRWPAVYGLGVMLGLIAAEEVPMLWAEGGEAPANDDDPIVRYPVFRPTFQLARLQGFVQAPFVVLERWIARVEASGARPSDPIAMLRAIADALADELLLVMLELRRDAAENFHLQLDPAGLELRPPLLELVDTPPIVLPLSLPPGLLDRLELSVVHGGRLRVEWKGLLPTDEIGDVRLLELGGFVLGLAGGGEGNALILRSDDGVPVLELRGRVALELPTDVLAGLAGGRLRAEGGATLRFRDGEASLQLQPLELALTEPVRIGGAGGLVIQRASLTIGEFELSPSLELRLDRLPFTVSLRGELSLLDGDLSVGIAAEYAEQRWRLASSASLHLPNGIVLEPIDGRPVLSLDAAPGNAELAAAGRVRFPGAEGAPSTLELSGSLALRLTDTGVELDRLSMSARQDHWPLGDELVLDDFGLALVLDDGRIHARLSATIAIGDDFELGLLDAPPAALASALSGRELGLCLSPQPDRLDGELTCAMRLSVSPRLLSGGESGDASVGIDLAATLRFSSDPNREPSLSDLSFHLGIDRLHLGGKGGLVIESAELTATSIERLFALGREPHPILQFGGTLRCPVDSTEGTIDLTLVGARFVFDRADHPPRFEFADGGKLGFAAANVAGLPIRITEGSVSLREGDLPLADLLQPDNLIVELGAALDLEFGDRGTVIGAIEGVRAEIRHGRPCLSFTGVSVGVENLSFPPLMLSGALGLHGIDNPLDMQLEGVLGGSMIGVGVKALVAIKLSNGVPTPLGVCLDASLGPSGIPLAYGFVVIGAAGGISFANTNGDPCEFSTYASARQPIRAGRPMGSKRATGCANCPCDCPPRSLNLLCQPHPDQQRHSGRAILKFSAIDEPTWSAIPMIDPQAGATTLGSWLHEQDAALAHRIAGLDPARESEGLARRVVTAARSLIETMIPGLDPLEVGPLPPAPNLAPILAAPVEHWAAQAEASLRSSLELGLRRAQTHAAAISLHDVVGEVFERGIHCPDETLQITGTFSYTGVSMFLSVTGGINRSTAGSIGVLGHLNVLGIPFGQLRAFVTVTSDVGDPEPSLCGDLRFECGPLVLGELGFIYRSPGCITNPASTVAKFGTQLGEDLLGRALARIERPEARFADRVGFDLARDPATALALLSGPESSSLLAQLIAELPTLGAEEAKRVGHFLADLVAEFWAGYQPEILLCGKVAPKLFGLPLGGELVEARGAIHKDHFELQFGFSPIYLLGRICPIADMCSGMDTASMGVGMSLPAIEQVLVDGLTGHFAGQQQFERWLDQGLARILRDAVLVFSYQFFPLGMKLFDGQGRVVMPYLTPHPDGHASRWQNPDELDDRPSRREVLFAALDRGKLADVGWSGEIAELIELPVGTESLALQRDYFPHGGMLGASRLTVPRLLWDAPPLGLLAQASSAPQWREQVQAMITLIRDWVLATREAGTLSFYVPAPSPPGALRDAPGDNLRRMIDALVDLDLSQLLDGERLAGDLYRLDLAFFDGVLRGRLLGLDIGTAQIVFEPPAAAGGASELRARVDAAGDPRLRAWVRTGELAVVLSNPPADRVLAAPERETVEAVFTPLLAGLEQAMRSAGAAAPSMPGLRVPFGSQPKPSSPPPNLANVVDAFARRLPKVCATADVSLQIPADLRDFVSATGPAELRLYSPFYDPSALGDSPDARARRGGGLVMRARLAFQIPSLWRFEAQAELALVLIEGDARARLDGRVVVGSVANLSLLGTPLALVNAELLIRSDPPPGQPVLALRGTMASLRIGQLEVLSRDGNPMQLAVEAGRIDGAVSLGLRLPAAHVRWPGIGSAALELSGGVIGPTGGALGVVVPRELELSAAGVVLLRVVGSGTGVLQLAAGRSTVKLTFAAGVALDLLPGDPQLRRQIVLARALELECASDGRFSASFDLPALVLDGGLFTIEGSASVNAPLSVRIDDEGLHLLASANLVCSLPGGGRQSARLDSLEVGRDRSIAAAGSGATLRLPGICSASASSFAFTRDGSAFRLALADTQLGFDALPGFSARWSFTLGPDFVAAQHRSGATSLSLASGPVVEGEWSLVGSNFQSLTLRAKLRQASVFGQALSVTAQAGFDLALGPKGSITGSLAAKGDVSLLPNLLALSIDSIGIVGPTVYELRGRLRAFWRSAAGWAVDVGLSARIGEPSASTPNMLGPVMTKPAPMAMTGMAMTGMAMPRTNPNAAVASFDVPSVTPNTSLFNRAGMTLVADLGFGRDVTGFYLSLGSTRVGWAGVELARVDRKLRSLGPIVVDWSNPRSWVSAPVQIDAPSGNVTIDLAGGTATCTLAAGTLKLGGAGWPSLSAPTPQVVVRWTGGATSTATARASFVGANGNWQTLGAARWRVEGPTLDLDLSFGNGLTVRRWVRGARVAVESSAQRPDKKPWATASAALSDIDIVRPESVSVTLPALPDVGDPFSGARSECEKAAKLLPPLVRRPDCSALHPKPPTIQFGQQAVAVPLSTVFVIKT